MILHTLAITEVCAPGNSATTCAAVGSPVTAPPVRHRAAAMAIALPTAEAPAFFVASCEACVRSRYRGTATAARMPRITMTMTSSISVNPSSCLRIAISLSFLSGPQPMRALARVRSLIGDLQLVKHLQQQGRAQADQNKQAAERCQRSCQPRMRADEFVRRAARRVQVGVRQACAILPVGPALQLFQQARPKAQDDPGRDRGDVACDQEDL